MERQRTSKTQGINKKQFCASPLTPNAAHGPSVVCPTIFRKLQQKAHLQECAGTPNTSSKEGEKLWVVGFHPGQHPVPYPNPLQPTPRGVRGWAWPPAGPTQPSSEILAPGSVGGSRRGWGNLRPAPGLTAVLEMHRLGQGGGAECQEQERGAQETHRS